MPSSSENAVVEKVSTRPNLSIPLNYRIMMDANKAYRQYDKCLADLIVKRWILDTKQASEYSLVLIIIMHQIVE